MKLEPDDVEAIARRIAELLATAAGVPRRYVDAAALARTLGVERDWVYAHGAQLGAIRLGGPHGRLRFDVEHVRSVLARQACPQGPAALSPPAPAPRRRSRGD